MAETVWFVVWAIPSSVYELDALDHEISLCSLHPSVSEAPLRKQVVACYTLDPTADGTTVAGYHAHLSCSCVSLALEIYWGVHQITTASAQGTTVTGYHAHLSCPCIFPAPSINWGLHLGVFLMARCCRRSPPTRTHDELLDDDLHAGSCRCGDHRRRVPCPP